MQTQKIRIDRKKWRRGQVGQEGLNVYLWKQEDKLGCCLGHLIHQKSKCSWVELHNKFYPMGFFKGASYLTEKKKDYSFNNGVVDNAFASAAAEINDNDKINNQEREARLIVLFANNGFALEFYN